VLRQAPAEIVRLALVGIENDFLGRVLNLLPASEARLLRKQLDNLGPTRLSDVEQAQQELAKLAAQLESAGGRERNDRKHLSIAV
jgi:flagellar motor switch protein FliG